MNIIGTEKIKGVVEIPCLNKQITRGQTVTISENQFSHSEVQAAIKMGFIKKVEGSNEQVGSSTKIIRCRNNTKKPMRLHCVAEEVPPNALFDIKESDLSNGDIMKARASNMITIEETVEKQEITEKKITVKKEIPKKVTTDTNDEIQINDKQQKNNEVVFNPNGEKIVANKKPEKSVREINLDIQTFSKDDEVDSNTNDPKKKSVVYNPSGTERKAIPGATVWDPRKDEEIKVFNKHDEVNPNEEKGKSMVYNPAGSENKSTDMKAWNPVVEIFNRDDEVDPAGKEPTKIAGSNNDEIIFVDEEAEKARIAAHPKLSKAKSKTKKVINSPFIDEPEPQNSGPKVE